MLLKDVNSFMVLSNNKGKEDIQTHLLLLYMQTTLQSFTYHTKITMKSLSTFVILQNHFC